MPLVAEGIIDCIRGSPWRGAADVGNFFQKNFKTEGGRPDTVYSMDVSHWSSEHRLRGLLLPYHGVASGRLLVFHAEIDPQTKCCAVCGTEVGIPDAD